MIPKLTVKYIQSLQHKKFRDEHGSFLAEGPKVVLELLESNIFELEALYFTKNALTQFDDDLSKLPKNLLHQIEDFELEKITSLHTANLLLAIFKKKKQLVMHKYENNITLLLDDVQDPGNLGTIIRIADWFGIENLVCSKATADVYNPKVVQSTMASIGRVNVVYVELEDFVKTNSNIVSYAATLNGKMIEELKPIKEGFLVIGNESKGISENIKRLCTHKVSIGKHYGKAESLNAAVATGILLHEIL